MKKLNLMVATRDGEEQAQAWLPNVASRISVTHINNADPTLTHTASGMGLGSVLAFANGFRPKSVATLLVAARAIERETKDHLGWTVLQTVRFGQNIPSDPQLKSMAVDWAMKAREAAFRAVVNTSEYRAWRKGWATIGL